MGSDKPPPNLGHAWCALRKEHEGEVCPPTEEEPEKQSSFYNSKRVDIIKNLFWFLVLYPHPDANMSGFKAM